MQRLIIIILVGFLPVIGFGQPSISQEEVMMKMLALKEALISKDSLSLDQLLASDVTYVHSNGMVQSKSELIASVMTGQQDYKSIVPSDMKIRIFGGGTAVVTMKSDYVMNYKGSALNMKMFVTLVWVKKNKWQLEARQSVKQ